MLNSLLFASLLIQAPGVCLHHHAEPPLVASAWRELDEQVDKRHEADLKADAELGAKYAAEVEKEFKLSSRQDAVERVERIGAALAKVAQETPVRVSWGDRRLNPFSYRFKVIEEKDVNAFSLPGGFIYVYEGLVDFCESDHELAGVLSHEIAHAAFRHIATFQREQSKFSTATLPLIIAIILGGGREAGNALTAVQLTNVALGSGWSINAEEAADLGGIQYMARSDYNPVGILTFMERLARRGGFGDIVDLGILRTHPPSRQRAATLTKHLQEMGIPIRRSEVTTSFRTIVKPGDAGAVEGWFGQRRVFRFAGADAIARADLAAKRLNAFFDEVPELHEVSSLQDGTLLGRRRPLFQYTAEDAATLGKPLASLVDEAEAGIKRSLYSLAYRIWDAR
ncbi:MAG TPA: M48 family metalloprotease [Fimbriimonadaceae bacterium]|nr:M48 family metalloprotease [Fimbriimonadaceae bacterium]